MPDTDKLNELRIALAKERDMRKRAEGVASHLFKKLTKQGDVHKGAIAFDYLESVQEEGRKNVRWEYREHGIVRLELGALG